MIRRPRFKRHLSVYTVPPDLLLLEDDWDHVAFQGELFPLLAPLIDGQREVADIVAELEGRAIVLDVHHGLELLEKEGCLADAEEPRPPMQLLVGDLLDVGVADQRQRLDSTTVEVRACGAIDTVPLESLLRDIGARVGSDADLEIVLVDDYLNPALEAINLHALEASKPWLLVKPAGPVIWLGPLFDPGSTACWACLARRLRQNRPVPGFAAALGGQLVVPAASEPAPHVAGALGLAAREALRWIVQGRNDVLADRLHTLDLGTLRCETHRITRFRDCPRCREPEVGDGAAPGKVTLRSHRRLFLADGGHRTSLPEDTFRRYRHHISPLTGIVDRIRAVHREDFTQLWVTSYGLPEHHHDRRYLQKGLRARATGKGIYAAQARTSALCEALERFSGFFRGSERRQRVSFETLGEQAIHPNDLMLISDAQFEHREAWNERERDFNWIPHPFDASRAIEWSGVWSLTHERVRYVPTAYCYYGYEGDRDLFRPDSNGNAAGNTIEEAILQGFMEVVERDCVAVWWYNRLRRPAVDLASFDMDYFAALEEYYRSLGREIWVLDLTGDLGIPAFGAISKGPSRGNPDDLLLGFGAHFDPLIGVSRAVTEMNQFLPAVRKGRPMRVASETVYDESFLVPDPGAAARRRLDYPQARSDDLLQDVERCVRIARERSLEVLVLDQTRPDVGLPVAKVIVPGMRPFWARFAPGRLYEVPAKLGWLRRPLPERDLNEAHLVI